MAKKPSVAGITTGKLRDLTDRYINHRINVEKYATGTVKKIDRLLEDATYDLEKRLRRANLSKQTIKTLNAALSDVKAMRAATFRSIKAAANKDFIDLSKYEAEFVDRLYNDTLGAAILPATADISVPKTGILRQLVSDDMFGGRFINEWLDKLRIDEQERIKVQLRLGIVEGDSNAQIVSRIIGGDGYRGVVDVTKRWAETFVRSAVSSISQSAHMAYLEENSDLFPQVMWSSVLDEATCAECAAYSGEVYDLEDAPEIPAHPNCRCVYIGVANGMPIEDMQSGASYDEWLQRQSDARAEEVLGPGRYELWKGGMSVRSFIDSSGESLTLDELRAKDGG